MQKYGDAFSKFSSIYWPSGPISPLNAIELYLRRVQQCERFQGLVVLMPEASSTMRALSSACCTGVRLYTLPIKIGTNQRALGELSHCWTRLRLYTLRIKIGTCTNQRALGELSHYWTRLGLYSSGQKSQYSRVLNVCHVITNVHS